MRIALTLFQVLIFQFVVNAQTVFLTELCEMPNETLESSGFEVGPEGCFWTHNDSGNPSTLYCVDTTGTIVRTVDVVGDANTDWEELAKDDDGNIYIGNFGNNSLSRTNLRIVKIPSIDTCTTTAYVTDTILFSYPDQQNYPPVGNYGNFDMEAMFWHQDSLHLFSKDRSNPSTGYTKYYRLPAVGGNYTALLVDSFYAGHTSFVFAVTAADIYENGDQAVLLSADRVWLFRNFNGTNYFGGDVSELQLGSFSQKEGVCFKNGFIYITDEESFGLGGKMYRLHPDVFVAVNERSDTDLQPVYNNELRFDHLKFNVAEPVAWQLYSTEGKLVAQGVAESVLDRKMFGHRKNGVYVLRVNERNKKHSILIKL